MFGMTSTVMAKIYGVAEKGCMNSGSWYGMIDARNIPAQLINIAMITGITDPRYLPKI